MRDIQPQIRHSDPKGYIFRTPCPFAASNKKGGAPMQCYMLDYNQTLFPSIPVSKNISEHITPLWQIDIGSLGKGGEYVQMPVPWNSHITINPSNPNYGSVRVVPIVSGQYLVYITDQSIADRTWNITCSDNHMVLAKGISTHGDSFPDHAGPEYLCSMIPGDWFAITQMSNEWESLKVTIVIAGKHRIEVLKKERIMIKRKSFLPSHLPNDGEALIG